LSAGSLDFYNLGWQYLAGEAVAPVSEYRQEREKIKADEAEAESVYKAKTSEHPVARFLGEAAPYAAVPLGAGPARAAMIGAGLGGLTYNPDPTMRGVQAAAGMIGGVGGQQLNRLIPDMPLGTPGARSAQQLGLQLPPGQAFDNRLLQRLELPMKSTPLLAGRFDRMNNANQAVFNRMVAREVGLGDVTKIRPQDYGRAWRSVSNEFNRLTEKVSVNVDDQLMNDLGRIEQEQLGSIVRNDPFEPIFNRLLDDLSDDVISGPQFQKYSHDLGKKAHVQLTSSAGDRELGLALYQVKESLDDALERSMGVATRKRYQEARHKWRILKALEARGALHERVDVSATTTGKYYMKRCGELGRIPDGNTSFPVMEFYRMYPDYEHYWRVEYDVRFYGNWTDLFDYFADNNADLLTTTLYRYAIRPEWMWWNSLKTPCCMFAT